MIPGSHEWYWNNEYVWEVQSYPKLLHNLLHSKLIYITGYVRYLI